MTPEELDKLIDDAKTLIEERLSRTDPEDVKNETQPELMRRFKKRGELNDQWTAMIDRGIQPVIEYPTVGNNYLTVDVWYSPSGLYFELDMEGETRFSEEVLTTGHLQYHLPFDLDMDYGLDHYLQEVTKEVTEGFLIPNELYNHE